jgi:tetratricopeptide (TPR) repeat protein
MKIQTLTGLILFLMGFVAPLAFPQTTAGEHLQKASEYIRKDMWDEAIAECSKAIEINPRDAEAYNRRGIAYANKGDTDKAITDYTKAIEIDPKLDLAYANRAGAYDKIGEHGKSLQDRAKARELEKLAPKDDFFKNAMESIGKDHAGGSKRPSETGVTNSPPPSSSTTDAAPADDQQELCDRLLGAPFEKHLPNGYSSPKASLTQMTAAEHTAGMVCKISVVLQGPDRFNAIRYRIYDNEVAAKRGFNSLSKELPPDIALIADNLQWESEKGGRAPCMAFTAGNRSLTFVACADQSGPIVVSGVSSQSNGGNSYDMDTVTRAGQLLVHA